MSSFYQTTRATNCLKSLLLAAAAVLFLGCENSNVAVSSPAEQTKSKETSVEPEAYVPQSKTKQANQETNKQIPSADKTKSPRVTVKKEPLLTRNGKTYNPNQLHKNQTLLVLAAQKDIRARLILAPFRTIVTEQQYQTAYDIAIAHDQQFDELLRERAAVLETAFDGQSVDDQLTDIKMRTADLLINARRKIQRKVLSREQQQAAVKLWNDWIDLEKQGAAAQAKNAANKAADQAPVNEAGTETVPAIKPKQ